MAHTVCLIPGDGIGPEVAEATRAVIDASGAAITWVELPAGAGAVAEYGDVLPAVTLEAIRKHKVALKGPGANIGDDCAVFEAVHGSAPDIAGKNAASPLALLMSGVMMLNHLGETAAAERIKRAYDAVLEASDPREITRDIGGQAGTDAFAAAVIARLDGTA